jgi:hypothetical protein
LPNLFEVNLPGGGRVQLESQEIELGQSYVFEVEGLVKPLQKAKLLDTLGQARIWRLAFARWRSGLVAF